MPIKTLSLAVVGAAYPNKKGPPRTFAVQLAKPGDPVALVPEPKNPVDPRAVAVYSAEGVQMGYLTAERAPWIGGMMKEGRDIRVIFQEAVKGGAIIRVTLDGSEPKLPATPPKRTKEPPPPIDPDPDFYPDEVWPDE